MRFKIDLDDQYVEAIENIIKDMLSNNMETLSIRSKSSHPMISEEYRDSKLEPWNVEEVNIFYSKYLVQFHFKMYYGYWNRKEQCMVEDVYSCIAKFKILKKKLVFASCKGILINFER